MRELDRCKQTFQGVCESLEKSWPTGCMNAVETSAPDIHKRIKEALLEVDKTWGKNWEPFAKALFKWRVACEDAIRLFTHGDD